MTLFKKKKRFAPKLDKELGQYSLSFQEFYQHYVLDPSGLIRNEVNTSFLHEIQGEERELMLRFFRSSLTEEEKRTYIIEAIGELRDNESVGQLSSLFKNQKKLGWKIPIAEALFRINGDNRYNEAVTELYTDGDQKEKEFYQHHIVATKNKEGIRFLIEQLKTKPRNQHRYSLTLLIFLKTGVQYSFMDEELPFTADYFIDRINNVGFIEELSG